MKQAHQQKSQLEKTENNGRAFVVLEDGEIRTWEEYSTFSGNSMQQNIFPKHEMSLVFPKKTTDTFRDHFNHTGVYQKSSHTNDSFNIRCYTEPGIRKSFGDHQSPPNRSLPAEESLLREKFYNYRCFDIKRWK